MLQGRREILAFAGEGSTAKANTECVGAPTPPLRLIRPECPCGSHRGIVAPRTRRDHDVRVLLQQVAPCLSAGGSHWSGSARSVQKGRSLSVALVLSRHICLYGDFCYAVPLCWPSLRGNKMASTRSAPRTTASPIMPQPPKPGTAVGVDVADG